MNKRFLKFSRMVVALTLALVCAQSMAFAANTTTGIDKIGTAVDGIGNDLIQYVVPAIAFLVFIWAGFKVMSGQRDAIPWAIAGLAGVIISLNAGNIKSWLVGFGGGTTPVP